MEEKKKIAIRLNVMAILLIIIFSAAIVPVTFQNDTYYTIKIGEFITQNGIKIQQDPFSWHENLEYTFPHWLYDVFIYLFYNIGGFAGVYISTVVLSVILGLLMYYINVKLIKNKILSFILTIITMYLLKPYICARAQLITFILFLLTIYYIEKFLETRKIRYAIGLIIIPILIANLHLATFPFYFILYLPYLAEFALYILAYCNVIISQAVVDHINKKINKNGETPELLEKLEKAKQKNKRIKDKQDARIENSYKLKLDYRKNTRYLIIIFIICLFAGLLTPLGTTPYTYLIKTMQGISTKNISEHLPTVLIKDIRLVATFATYAVLLALMRSKIRVCDICMVAGLSALALYTRRQESILFLIGVVIINRLLHYIITRKNPKLMDKIEKNASKLPVIAVISVVIIGFSVYIYKPKLDFEYVDEGSYPVQASEWIKENLDVENIKLYNQYNFGSYLIYQNIPVFIDSRCDLYLPEFNEGVYVFRDFLNFSNVSIANMEEKFEEYGFTHFLVSNDLRIKMYLDDKPEKYKVVYPVDDIEDDTFTIYEKIK